jgi:hypothetical protein
MTPQEKSQQLVDKYFLLTAHAMDEKYGWVAVSLNKSLAKQCAIIAVDFYLTEFQSWAIASCCDEDFAYDYWNEVKQEIEKIII